MKKTDLIKLLKNKKNEIFLSDYKSIVVEGKETWRKKFETALEHTYCNHNTGWGPRDKGTLEEHEKSLLDSIDLIAAVQIKLKYDSLKKMREGWEKHWLRQMSVRMERFEYITDKVWTLVEEILKDKVIDDEFVATNFKKLTKGFEVTLEDIKNSTLTYDQVLKKLSNKEITVAKSKELLKRIEEDNADKLCQFSGSGRNADQGTRICTRTGDPKKRGDCGTCRVAAEWEEAYG